MQPHNVVSGSFHTADTKDWAVLCSIDRSSRILIYRGGVVRGLSEKPHSLSPDRNWIQGGIGFSRAIGAADAKAMAYYHKEFGGPTPPPIDHEGLEESYVGKASTIHYWYDGTWLELVGAD